MIELPLAPPFLAKMMQVLAVFTEHQDMAFSPVDHINISLGVKVYVRWILELAWTITKVTKCSKKVQSESNI